MKRKLLRRGICAGLFLLSAALGAQALAQSYPSRSLRFIVPYAPGAINDVVARTVGQKLAETLGKAVVIDNRSGGGTIVGTEIAVRSPPDGHTLLMTSAAHAITPALYGKLPYDAMRDLTQVTVIGAAPLVLVVNPSLPAKSVKDLIALAKAKPGQLTYGSSGTGGGAHLVFEMLEAMAGIELTHVPYKGAGPAVIDVIGGQVHMTMATIVAVGRT
jgi:tripartite-type tricarboxylate transporter receptor subunit TctC